ncbi:hypothetical protein CTAYLR_005634, partial [Chrysophaeum taylorii]
VVQGDRFSSKELALLRVLEENEAAKWFVKASDPWLGPIEEGQIDILLRNLATKATLGCKSQGCPCWVWPCRKEGWCVEEVLDHTSARGSYKPARGESRSNCARKHLVIVVKLMSDSGNNTRKWALIDLSHSVLRGVLSAILQLSPLNNTLQQLEQAAIVEYLGPPDDDTARLRPLVNAIHGCGDNRAYLKMHTREMELRVFEHRAKDDHARLYAEMGRLGGNYPAFDLSTVKIPPDLENTGENSELDFFYAAGFIPGPHKRMFESALLGTFTVADAPHCHQEKALFIRADADANNQPLEMGVLRANDTECGVSWVLFDKSILGEPCDEHGGRNCLQRVKGKGVRRTFRAWALATTPEASDARWRSMPEKLRTYIDSKARRLGIPRERLTVLAYPTSLHGDGTSN